MTMMMPGESVPMEGANRPHDYRRDKYEGNECNSALHKSRRILCDARLSIRNGSEQLKDIKV